MYQKNENVIYISKFFNKNLKPLQNSNESQVSFDNKLNLKYKLYYAKILKLQTNTLILEAKSLIKKIKFQTSIKLEELEKGKILFNEISLRIKDLSPNSTKLLSQYQKKLDLKIRNFQNLYYNH
jgi:hypothetical protein